MVDKTVEELIRKVRQHTFLPAVKLRKIASLLAKLDEERVPGAIVECGVYKGGCSAFMASLSKERKIWLLDSFCGLPHPTEEDICKRKLGKAHTGERNVSKLVRPGEELEPIGWCIGTRSVVEDLLFERMKIERYRVGLIEGWLQDTLPLFTPGLIAFLYIDVDWYESTKLCLEHLYDKVTPNGYVGIDDYHFWPGCRVATDQFLKVRKRVKMSRAGSAVYWKRGLD